MDFGSDDEWPFGNEIDPEVVIEPSGAGCLEISVLLARADEEAREFSFGGPACTLPVAPRLFVSGAGPILTPLSEEQAQKVIKLCDKSPFGHNQDTKMDENVRKSWQLEPSLVQFQNPLWQSGMEKLSKIVAYRLGYEGVPLQCTLYKLLVYGEGCHFLKHQDTEKEDGMIATLVVQPPSTHEGGDLVVYRSGEVTYRHDFGKADGTADYLPHYAVHYADSEHALEKVAKGYRLVLVYSICLPSTMRHLERHHDKPLSESLAKAIGTMDDENDSFALLLDHEYTKKSIRNLGSGALKGVDRARFQALEGANAMVPTDKKLQFFFARLEHDITRYEDQDTCEIRDREESIMWFSNSGKELGQVTFSRTQLNFLNPNQKTVEELWGDYGEVTKEGGYTGNEGSDSITTYSRYALVAWLNVRHPENALKLMTADVAVEALHGRKTFGVQELRAFLSEIGDSRLSIPICRLFCEMLGKAGDSDVVSLFFENSCGALGSVEGNDTLIPSIAKIVRKFEWSKIGKPLLHCLKERHVRGNKNWGEYSAIELSLHLVDGLDSGVAQQALIKKIVDQATKLNEKNLFTAKYIGLLWKWVCHSGDRGNFDALANELKQADSSLLGPSIEYLSEYLDSDASDGKFDVLVPLATKRSEWLKMIIDIMDKQFSWEMPDAKFIPNEKVQSFLRGPEDAMTTTGLVDFESLIDAQNCSAKWMHEKQHNCSFEAKAAKVNESAFVSITKTRAWFLKQQSELVQYKAELCRLMDRFGRDGDGRDKKRTRLDSQVAELK